MNETMVKTPAFKLKGRLYTFTVMQLLQADKALFERQLLEMIEKAPKLSEKTPIVLDLSLIREIPLKLEALVDCLKANQLFLVGLQGASLVVAAWAESQGLAVLNASSTQDKPMMDYQPEEQAPVPSVKTKLLTLPIRSGQQVVSKGGDLVVTASVSHGAELLADGHIHVYGVLRGRALAGISGDKQARIFCQALDAELVSIAGFYKLSDALTPYNGPCQIYLKGESIQVEPLC